jgi:hypothetical protein
VLFYVDFHLEVRKGLTPQTPSLWSSGVMMITDSCYSLSAGDGGMRTGSTLREHIILHTIHFV